MECYIILEHSNERHLEEFVAIQEDVLRHFGGTSPSGQEDMISSWNVVLKFGLSLK